MSSDPLVIFGPPGSGKSFLIKRLQTKNVSANMSFMKRVEPTKGFVQHSLSNCDIIEIGGSCPLTENSYFSFAPGIIFTVDKSDRSMFPTASRMLEQFISTDSLHMESRFLILLTKRILNFLLSPFGFKTVPRVQREKFRNPKWLAADYEVKKNTVRKDVIASSCARRGVQMYVQKRPRLFGKTRPLLCKDVSLSKFRSILRIDYGRLLCEVEGMATFEDICNETLKYRLLPCVVPPLKCTSVGAAITLGSINSSSFRKGTFFDTVTSVEVMLGDGSIVTCSRRERQDLFYALPNSFSTLCFIFKVEFQLECADRFINVFHVKYGATSEYWEALKNACVLGHDYVEGVIFADEKKFLCIGDLVEGPSSRTPLNRRSYELPPYHAIVEGQLYDCLETASYIWRWDTDVFWLGSFFKMNSRILRFVFGHYLLGSRSLIWLRLLVKQLYSFSLTASSGGKSGGLDNLKAPLNSVLIPAKHAEEFFIFYNENVKIFPVWVVPVKSEVYQHCPLVGVDTENPLINFFFWDLEDDATPGSSSQLANISVFLTNKIHSLRGTWSYVHDEKTQVVPEEEYLRIKSKYDPDSIMPRSFVEEKENNSHKKEETLKKGRKFELWVCRIVFLLGLNLIFLCCWSWKRELLYFDATSYIGRKMEILTHPEGLAAYAGKSFPELKNDRILRAAAGEEVDRVPIWVMRQAGRYLPEFRKLREEYDFFTMVRTPRLACEITMQPIRRYDLDASIIFSDILVIPQALGMEVQMVPGKGPHFPDPLASPEDIDLKLNLKADVHKELAYVYEAISLTRHELGGKVPLFGFCGAPWTIMAYMIEGGGTKFFSKSKPWLFDHKEASHRLLNIVATMSIEYLLGQVEAGAQMLQVFESWAGELNEKLFREYSLPYLQRICKEVKDRQISQGKKPVPMVVFAKGAYYALNALSTSGYDVVSLDSTIDPEIARKETNNNVTLQGNLDTSILYTKESVIKANAIEMVKLFGKKRYIANLGHGMQPDMPPEGLQAFIEAVHSV
eukprot:Nk52_evm58s1444 gene=Nk52_evmTU58s1444